MAKWHLGNLRVASVVTSAVRRTVTSARRVAVNRVPQQAHHRWRFPRIRQLLAPHAAIRARASSLTTSGEQSCGSTDPAPCSNFLVEYTWVRVAQVRLFLRRRRLHLTSQAGWLFAGRSMPSPYSGCGSPHQALTAFVLYLMLGRAGGTTRGRVREYTRARARPRVTGSFVAHAN
jgi:hypothetical protein